VTTCCFCLIGLIRKCPSYVVLHLVYRQGSTKIGSLLQTKIILSRHFIKRLTAPSCAAVVAVLSPLSILYRTRHTVQIYYRRNQNRNQERILESKWNYFPTCPWFLHLSRFVEPRISTGFGTCRVPKRRKGFTAYRNEFATTLQEHPVVKWEMPRFINSAQLKYFIGPQSRVPDSINSWHLRSSGMLRQAVQEFFLDYLTLVDGTDRLSRNVGNYQSTLHNSPEERISNLHSGGSQKSRMM
jgi:hypothetical protein